MLTCAWLAPWPVLPVLVVEFGLEFEVLLEVVHELVHELVHERVHELVLTCCAGA